MTGSWLRLAAACLSTAIVSGCSPRPIIDRHWPDAYWRSGDYVLIAVDTEAQMSLCFDVQTAARKSVITVIEPTVFSVGANEHYIVAKQHPLAGTSQQSFDRATTNYLIVDRTKPPTWREPETGLRGPMNKEQFDALGSSLVLPRFSKTFHKLEWQTTDE